MIHINTQPASETPTEAPPTAILVGIITPGSSRESEVSLGELERLADTAGIAAAGRLTQTRMTPDPAAFIGSGKLDEVKALAASLGAGTVIFDAELSPSQIKNIEKYLGEPRVIDRTMLILEIFAQRADSAEGKLQVEIAQLRYTYPRLSGRGAEMSRLGGGGGGAGAGARRGSGETKLEADRRSVKARIAQLRRELDGLAVSRSVMRSQRVGSGLPLVAVAGYTNAGKSTLLNRLTDAGVFAEDKLFATLDPTVRKLTLPSGMRALMSDTVGFIRNLPHHLIDAFKSTLDEIRYADLIVLLADLSDPEHESQLAVARGLLAELGAGEKPVLTVYNKIDKADMGAGLPEKPGVLYISASTGEGLPRLLEAIEGALGSGRAEVRFRFKQGAQAHLDRLYRTATVTSVEYLADAVEVSTVADARTRGALAEYIVRG